MYDIIERIRKRAIEMDEASYVGNLGFVEMVSFYQSANDSQIKKMEKLLKNDEKEKAWKFLQTVTGKKLKSFKTSSNFSRV